MKNWQTGLLVAAFAVALPKPAAAWTWRDCKVALASAAIVGFVWQEVDYGAARRTYQWGRDGFVEWRDRMQRESDERAAREAAARENAMNKVALFRKDRKARVEFLRGELESTFEARNEMAAKGDLTNPYKKPAWDALNARLVTLQQEIDEDRVDTMRADVLRAEAALPRSLNYEGDRQKLEAARVALLNREGDLYAGLFAEIPLPNQGATHKPNAPSARKYLAEWPWP